MGEYTNQIRHTLYDLSADEDMDRGQLMAAVALFRTFDEALDTFLSGHGYTGPMDDVPSKISFLRERFRKAGCGEESRKIGPWYTKHSRIDFKSAVYFAYAFGLSLEEYSDFCRRISLTRGLDCHSLSGAVHYYCIKNHLPYTKAREILCAPDSGIPDGSLPRDSATDGSFPRDQLPASSLPTDQEIIYTDVILDELDRIENVGELIAWLAANRETFTYNNAAASRTVRRLWERIASPDGLAAKEAEKFSLLYGSSDKLAESDGSVSRIRPHRRIGVTRKYSSWDIILHILGRGTVSEQIDNRRRSLKPILNNTRLLHVLACENFPSRPSVDKILRGEHTNEETVRKLIIFLFFYQFWAEKNLRCSGFYEAVPADWESFRYSMDQHLNECHFPALYCGNPYDWIFLYASRTDSPLTTFRLLMGEVFLDSEDY